MERHAVYLHILLVKAVTTSTTAVNPMQTRHEYKVPGSRTKRLPI